MNRLIKSGRAAALAVLLAVLALVYVVFLYKQMIVEGETIYNQSNVVKTDTRTVTARRGNILDRYGRIIVSNKECYNLTVNATKLFSNDDPNGVILDLVKMVESYGDKYSDDLPVTALPPFEYTDMTDIQRTMLDAYLVDKKMSPDTTAVELMSYMRSRYDIANDYSAEQMRVIAGVRYSINVRYAVNTGDYVFVEDAGMDLITAILENKLDGINIERSYVRDYNTEYAAHILGYVGLMTQEEFERYSLLEYANNAMVGKDGVEYAFENYLHGKDGTVRETKNTSGTVLATFYEEDPQPGNHVYLTIDLALQEAVERILGSCMDQMVIDRNVYKEEQTALGLWTYEEGYYEISGASAVVVKVKTGEPLAMASWPTYDPTNVIENYATLLKAENAPLFNRVLLGTYAPGSTFKPCTAMACLSEGIINTETKIKCDGVFTKYAADGYAPECWIWSMYKFKHGEDTVTEGIRDSCNYFFYTIGEQLGIDYMEEYAHNFGLGMPTGIELPETLGNMSNQRNHADYTGSVWRIGDTLQAAIGQSDSIFTPMQMAEYCAAIANNGERHSASILKSVRTYDYSDTIFEREDKVMSRVESADYNWEAVHEGMFAVTNDLANNAAVAENFVDVPGQTGGKTGTAQKGENKINDGLFMCYYPFRDPEIAIVIIVERGGSGADVSYIARKILDVYRNIMSYSDTSESEMMLLK